jgi:hypothetical protein
VPQACGPRPSSPRAPRPAGPDRVSLYKLAGRAAEALVPSPLFAPTLRTCWSRLDASCDSSACSARTDPGGPIASLPVRNTLLNCQEGRSGDVLLRFRSTLALRVDASDPLVTARRVK